jgi:hypothetical protein
VLGQRMNMRLRPGAFDRRTFAWNRLAGQLVEHRLVWMKGFRRDRLDQIRLLGHLLSVVVTLAWFGFSLSICSCTASPTSGDTPHVSPTPSGLASRASVPAAM